jgi:GT2 family glycosyltransferase
MNIMLTIGIVIYNEEKQIERLEKNLNLFQGTPVLLILVDNASTDGTLRYLEKWEQKFPIKLIRRSKNHMGEARAEVIRQAQSEWVGFIDADCEISSAWIKTALNNCRQGGHYSAVGGPLLPEGDRRLIFTSLFKSFFGNMNSVQAKAVSEDGLVSHLPTANVIYRREDVIGLGNFDLTKKHVGEDLEMSYRLCGAGKKLRLDPDMALNHYLPGSLYSWIKKVFHYGRARGQVGVQYEVIGTYPFTLPLLFFAFLGANIIFVRQWQAVPLAAYLFVVLGHSVYFGGRHPVKLFIYFLATHLAYASGMVWGVLQAFLVTLTSPMGDAPNTQIKRQ